MLNLQVGFIDLISKKTTLFPHYFQTQIYKIEWGPIKGDESNLGLYIVSEGKMAVYDLQQPTEGKLFRFKIEFINFLFLQRSARIRIAQKALRL